MAYRTARKRRPRQAAGQNAAATRYNALPTRRTPPAALSDAAAADAPERVLGRRVDRLVQLVREAIGIVDDDEIDPVDIRDWLKAAREELTPEQRADHD